jgi:hypothetical protein
MVGGAGERPAKANLTSLGFRRPDGPPLWSACARLGMLNNKSAHRPPRCAGDRPGALSMSVSLVRRGQNRRERVCGAASGQSCMRRILCKAFHRVKIFQGGRHRD